MFLKWHATLYSTGFLQNAFSNPKLDILDPNFLNLKIFGDSKDKFTCIHNNKLKRKKILMLS